MRRSIALTVIGCALLVAPVAKADLLPPLPPAKEGVGMKIEVDEKAKSPRLVLPQGAFLPPRVRPGPKSELPNENGDGYAQETEVEASPTTPRNSILMAGLALSLSLGFGGFWILRRNGKGSITGMVLLIATASMLTASAVVWANAPAPVLPIPPKPKAEAFPTAWDGKTSIEFSYGNEPVRLILDKESFEKLKKAEPK